MIGRRSVIGLCVLCALALSAFAAQSASAASNGTTLFTCTKTPVAPVGEKFSAEHCRDKSGASDTSPTGAWRHDPIAENLTTEITGTSTETSEVCQGSALHSVISGIETELISPCSHILLENEGVKSSVTNKVDATTGEHYYEGTAWLDYTEVKVKKPEGKGCKVKNETVIAHLKFTTLKQGDNIKFEPATAGKPFAEFTIEGCTIAALNGLYEVKGSVLVEPNGATLTTTAGGTTAQETLKLRGQNAGLAGTMTVRGRNPKDPAGQDTPLSPTTVATP
jgi:hypothetical protein